MLKDYFIYLHAIVINSQRTENVNGILSVYQFLYFIWNNSIIIKLIEDYILFVHVLWFYNLVISNVMIFQINHTINKTKIKFYLSACYVTETEPSMWVYWRRNH